MRGFPQNAVCVVGLSKAPSQNPITLDNTTGRIYAVQFNTICGITSNFLEEQLVGLSLLSDMEEMRKRIMTRYLGDSRKAIIVILRDAAAKLRERQTSAQ